MYGNTEKPKQENRNKYVWKENRWLLWHVWQMDDDTKSWFLTRHHNLHSGQNSQISLLQFYWDVIALWLNRNVQYFWDILNFYGEKKCPLLRNWRPFFITSTLRIFLQIFCIPAVDIKSEPQLLLLHTMQIADIIFTYSVAVQSSCFITCLCILRH